MAKFIELHVQGERKLVNLEHVVTISDEGQATIFYEDGWHTVDESYAKVRSMIASAAGGIPIGGST